MNEQETVQAILNWLASEGADYDAQADRLKRMAGNETVRVAELRLFAAMCRKIAYEMALGKWKAHAAGVELATKVEPK